jgi:RNA polymerase sigma-70 factor (ECF subfamily)
MNTTFIKTYQELGGKIHAYVLNKIKDEETAQDIVQDVFLVVHKQQEKFSSLNNPEVWVFSIAKNKVIDFYRTRKRHQSVDELPEFPEQSKDRREAIKLLAHDIQDMVNQLPAPYREVLQLTELEGMKYADVAQKLNISVPAVKSRVLRGREKMKELLFDCCHFEFDRNGGVVDFIPKRKCNETFINEPWN